MIEKYGFSPRLVELEIARNVITESGGLTAEIIFRLRQRGFKVIWDGFEGNFLALEQTPHVEIDELKLDLRLFEGKRVASTVRDVFERAAHRTLPVSVEGIESAEQATMLRRSTFLVLFSILMIILLVVTSLVRRNCLKTLTLITTR